MMGGGGPGSKSATHKNLRGEQALECTDSYLSDLLFCPIQGYQKRLANDQTPHTNIKLLGALLGKTFMSATWSFKRLLVAVKETDFLSFDPEGVMLEEKWASVKSLLLYTRCTTTQLSQKDKHLPFVTTWIELEGIYLCKISQKKKEKYQTDVTEWHV